MKTQNLTTYTEADQLVTAYADAICKARGHAFAVGGLQAHLSYAISWLPASERNFMIRVLERSIADYTSQVDA